MNKRNIKIYTSLLVILLSINNNIFANDNVITDEIVSTTESQEDVNAINSGKTEEELEKEKQELEKEKQEIEREKEKLKEKEKEEEKKKKKDKILKEVAEIKDDIKDTFKRLEKEKENKEDKQDKDKIDKYIKEIKDDLKKITDLVKDLKDLDLEDAKKEIKNLEEYIDETDKKLEKLTGESIKEDSLNLTKPNRYKNLYNVLELKNKGKVNLNNSLSSFLKDNYGAYYDKEISFHSDTLKIKKDNNENWILYVDEPGFHRVDVKNSYYKNKDTNIFIYLRDKKEKPIKRPIFTTNPYFTDKTKIKLNDYLLPEKDTTRILAESLFVSKDYSNKAYSLTEEIELDLNRLNSFTIHDLQGNQTFKFEIKQKLTSNEKPITSFKDLKGSHWAFNDIKDLTKKGLIKGYDDNTFRPDNNLTVKEFLSLFGNFIYQEPDKIKEAELQNHDLKLNRNDWSYLYSQLVFNRLSPLQLKRFDTNNLNRNITREEVAFLIDNVLNLEEQTEKENPKDIRFSLYKNEIMGLYNKNIIKGYPNNTFKPKEEITRAEISSIFYEIYNVNNNLNTENIKDNKETADKKEIPEKKDNKNTKNNK